MNRSSVLATSFIAFAVVSAAACGSADSGASTDSGVIDAAPATTVVADASGTEAEVIEPVTDSAPSSAPTSAVEGETEPVSEVASSFEIDVWADNWMAVYVDGVLIGEDSIPITTERSFNAETFTFDASPPFTIAIEARDFKQTDSGLEYIGEDKQQIGGGGIIAQVTDLTTGDVVTATDADWAALVIHQAPLNTECAGDADPDATCESLIVDTPVDWATPGFDDTGWSVATEWSAADVEPKHGYDEIDWDPSAQFIWGTDLYIDNTVLLRTTIS